MIIVEHGDSRDVLRTLADNSIDSVVTDPPYALVSIGKRFGADDAVSAKGGVYARASAGFMGKRWDTGETAFAVEFWAEVMRVLKPGGHVLAASGTRTYHRLACAIEDGGFEVRDMVSWLYGSGFPKSHDVSKAIDRTAGAEREVIGPSARHVSGKPEQRTEGLSGSATFAESVGMGAVLTAPATPEAARWSGWGTALKPACEPWVLARKPLIGTVAANVLAHGTGALNIDGCRVGTEGGTHGMDYAKTGLFGVGRKATISAIDAGRWPANVIHDGSDEVVKGFPAQAGASGKASGPTLRDGNTSVARGAFAGLAAGREPAFHADFGSAARYFYAAKATADDRIGSKHPTVKPVDLMRYLVRLVTPPGGTVLDPFAGTGSTGVACIREGFSAILIEREEEYHDDIQLRIAHAQGSPDPAHTSNLKTRNRTPKAPDDGAMF